MCARPATPLSHRLLLRLCCDPVRPLISATIRNAAPPTQRTMRQLAAEDVRRAKALDPSSAEAAQEEERLQRAAARARQQERRARY